jgi:hypothetical protein
MKKPRLPQRGTGGGRNPKPNDAFKRDLRGFLKKSMPGIAELKKIAHIARNMAKTGKFTCASPCVVLAFSFRRSERRRKTPRHPLRGGRA